MKNIKKIKNKLGRSYHKEQEDEVAWSLQLVGSHIEKAIDECDDAVTVSNDMNMNVGCDLNLILKNLHTALDLLNLRNG